MSIIDALKEYRSVKDYEGKTSEAIKEFENQIEALQQISETDGFKVILEYLNTMIEVCESRLDVDDSREVFAKYKAHKDLYRFLTSRVN